MLFVIQTFTTSSSRLPRPFLFSCFPDSTTESPQLLRKLTDQVRTIRFSILTWAIIHAK